MKNLKIKYKIGDKVILRRTQSNQVNKMINRYSLMGKVLTITNDFDDMSRVKYKDYYYDLDKFRFKHYETRDTISPLKPKEVKPKVKLPHPFKPGDIVKVKDCEYSRSNHILRGYKGMVFVVIRLIATNSLRVRKVSTDFEDTINYDFLEHATSADRIQVEIDYLKQKISSLEEKRKQAANEITIDPSDITKSVDGTLLIQRRKYDNYAGRGYWISPLFNWKIEKDSIGLLVLVPTKKS